LRRVDQSENLQRRLSFERVVKERLADDLIEKMVRGEIVTTEQAKLKEMCYR
jgi:hypothetical protein